MKFSFLTNSDPAVTLVSLNIGKVEIRIGHIRRYENTYGDTFYSVHNAQGERLYRDRRIASSVDARTAIEEYAGELIAVAVVALETAEGAK